MLCCDFLEISLWDHHHLRTKYAWACWREGKGGEEGCTVTESSSGQFVFSSSLETLISFTKKLLMNERDSSNTSTLCSREWISSVCFLVEWKEMLCCVSFYTDELWAIWLGLACFALLILWIHKENSYLFGQQMGTRWPNYWLSERMTRGITIPFTESTL